MGDERKRAIEILYDKYYRELFIYSFSLFDYRQQHLQDAEDCVQETFEKAVKNLEDVLKNAAPLKYLMVMCKNITLSRRRDIHLHQKILKFPQTIDEHFDVADSRDIVMDWMIRRENEEIKKMLLEELTDKEKTVYHLYFEQNMSIKETAQEMNGTAGSVRGSIQRIRSRAMKLQNIYFILIYACIFGVLCT